MQYRVLVRINYGPIYRNYRGDDVDYQYHVVTAEDSKDAWRVAEEYVESYKPKAKSVHAIASEPA